MASARSAFRRAMGRDPGRVGDLRQEVVASPQPLDRAALFHYWHPDRDGVEPAPPWFAERLAAIAGVDVNGKPNALCVRPPAGAPVRCRCWLIFKRAPEITHPISPGWFLVLAWHTEDYPIPKPLDLDNRVLANLHLQSVRAGREVMGRDFDSAVQYFDHCMRVLDRDKAQADREVAQYREDRASDYWDYTKIKNIGHGSKFALHHDGTIMPSRGEANWLRERGLSLPKDVVERDADETKPNAAVRGRSTVRQDSHAVWNDRAQTELNHLKFKQQIRDLAKLRRRSTVAVK